MAVPIRPWHPSEIDMLRGLVDAHTPIGAICAQLARPLKSVQIRAAREHILLPPQEAPPRPRLTPGQLLILTRLQTEARPLRIVACASGCAHARWSNREWVLMVRATSIDTLQRRGYIARESGARFHITECGADALARYNVNRRTPLPPPPAPIGASPATSAQ